MKCIPARYVLAVLGFIAMAIIYGLKVNLSVTMVAMLNHTAIKGGKEQKNETKPVSADECSPPPGSKPEELEDGEYDWDENLQAIILSCYFWGYMVGLIPGAIIAERLSAKWVMWGSVFINILCTLLTPVSTKLHVIALIVMRVLEGIAGGVTFPAMHCMIGAWSPPNERSTISAIIYNGCSIGTFISILMAGLIADWESWEAVFYWMGGLSCVWLVLWIVLVADTPAKAKVITEEERTYITSLLGTAEKTKPPPLPLKAILKSVPFWAIFVAHVCSNWGWYFLLIETPFYLKQILKYNISSNALISAMPYLILAVTNIFLGSMLDLLKKKEKITQTCARKFATGLASVVPAACLLGLCYIGCHHYAAVALVWIATITMGAMFSGFLSNHIDIAPKYAGSLVAITNTFGTLSGIIVPLFVGAVTKGDQTIHAWRLVFWVTIGLFVVEFVVYTAIGTGEEQPWANPEAK